MDYRERVWRRSEREPRGGMEKERERGGMEKERERAESRWGAFALPHSLCHHHRLLLLLLVIRTLTHTCGDGTMSTNEVPLHTHTQNSTPLSRVLAASPRKATTKMGNTKDEANASPRGNLGQPGRWKR